MAHHVPGRIRIKFTNGFLHHPLIQGLIGNAKLWPAIVTGGGGKLHFDADGMLSDTSVLPGLKSVRLNWRGRSIVIEYDSACWRPEWVHELLSTHDAVRVRNILQTMTEELNLRNGNLFT